MLGLNKGNIPTVFVAYSVFLTGIGLKRYFGCSFLKTLQKRQSFLYELFLNGSFDY